MKDLKIGAVISFGRYDWRVLEMHDDKALIVTEEIIDQRPYHDVYKPITWAECSLREYLNGAFYDAFTETEKARIVLVINQNVDNQWYGTEGGAPTEDHIFLLSLDDVCTYFGDSRSKLYNKGKNQRYWFERKDENNIHREARLQGKNGNWWWWLRSPGRVGLKAAYVWGDGVIGIQGNHIKIGNLADGKCTGGVRPALWLKRA